MSAGESRTLPTSGLVVDIFAGIVSAMVTIVYAIGCAVLVYSGHLTEYLDLGMTSAMVCTAVVGLIMALSSSFRFSVAGPDTRAAAVMALVAASLGASLQGRKLAYTVWITLAVGAILTGAFLYMMGRLGLGRSIRFIPYPVIGGFLAGTGWVLIAGAIKVMTGTNLTWHSFGGLLGDGQLIRWVPGLCFAVLLLIFQKCWRHPLLFPGLIVGGVLAAYLTIAACGLTPAAARDKGIFFQASSAGSFSAPYAAFRSEFVDWGGGASQVLSLAAIAAVVAITILMSATAIELHTGQDADFDHELRLHGFANVLSGAAGGIAGCLVINRTLLNYELGARGRRAGLICSMLCAGILLFNIPLLAYMPKAVLGGLLLYLGLSQLWEWVVQGWRKLSRLDYGIVVLIVFVIAFIGFLQGLALGCVVAAIIFAVDYSRISVVKWSLTGVHQRSNVERSARELRILETQGGRIHILWLHGFIFFGTANSIVEQVRQLIADGDGATPRYVVLDFTRVTGLDSSGMLSFVKLRRLAEPLGFSIVLTGLGRFKSRILGAGGIALDERVCRLYDDMDHGLEWCEEQILAEALPEAYQAPSIREHLSELLGNPAAAETFLRYLTGVDIEEGFRLFNRGEVADSLYFLESGRVSVMDSIGGRNKRLRSMGPGTVVGEMGLYSGARRSASVVADCATRVYCLTRESLNGLQEKEPGTAAAFHHFVVRTLAKRITSHDDKLRALME